MREDRDTYRGDVLCGCVDVGRAEEREKHLYLNY